MITQTMVQPSSWVEVGIKIQRVRGINLFKFTDELQARLEILIHRRKNSTLTPEETAELIGITELDRIFTLAAILPPLPPTNPDKSFRINAVSRPEAVWI